MTKDNHRFNHFPPDTFITIIIMSSIKKFKTSDVWDFFIKKGKDICQCNLCGKIYKTGGGTTNLKNHLARKHPSCLSLGKNTLANKNMYIADLNQELDSTNLEESDENYDYNSTSNDENQNEYQIEEQELGTLSRQSSCSSSSSFNTKLSKTSSYSGDTSYNFYTQPTIKSAFKAQQSFEEGGERDIKITQALIYMICKDNLPLSCTEKTGMIKFLKTTVPLYKAPSRKKITSLVEAKYSSLKSIISGVISNVNYISLTTDIATVLNSTRSFIVLTCHFIDEAEYSMHSLCLGVKNLTPHHTSINISDDLKNLMFDYWNIDKSKIVSATTDNGPNIVAGVKLLLNNNIHVSCFAHNLNLVVTKSLGADSVRELIEIINKIKNIVAYFKHSNVAQDDLRMEQRKEGKTDGTFLYLIQEVPTRWNSTYDCLKRFMLLSGHVGKILLSSHHKKAPSMLLPQECSEIEDVLELLTPFNLATNDISGQKVC
ncbi:hypothetical protein ABEB36_014999 [Hypothenemus hampei]|uniref:BED-type domain-containing protein n=1 Tax=Hypothenemus hampei TaxID=57062 RepID=A0ABD1E1T5_HYPHA